VLQYTKFLKSEKIFKNLKKPKSKKTRKPEKKPLKTSFKNLGFFPAPVLCGLQSAIAKP